MYHNLFVAAGINGSMEATMSDSPQKFLEVALAAVKKAEPIFCNNFGRVLNVAEKIDQGGHRSPVTEVDREIETVITTHLASYVPDHAIFGEELPPQKRTSQYTWFIDPIDGTTNYIRGLPFASISLGLWQDDNPLVAVVSDPMNNVLYSAIRGQGAFRNSTEKLSVSLTSALRDSVGETGRIKALADDPALQRVARKMYRGREYGGAALALCHIAEGRLDFWISERTKIFDDAAGMLILTGAGGKVTDWEGNQFKSNSPRIVASNGKIHQELLRTLHLG